MPAVKGQLRVGRRTIAVSNRDKVLFGDAGITKGDLIEYYLAVAPAMLPYLRDRPLTMERWPDGIGGERIFQKNTPTYFPEWIARAEVGKKGGSVTHPLANDTATLAYLANQACITHHLWLSTASHPFTPDTLIFDLDPSTTDFTPVRETALALREILEGLGLAVYVKTSGSKGLHVVVPLRTVIGFDRVYAFALAVANRIIAEDPTRLTMEFHKVKRGDRIYVDIGRNVYSATAAAPYTVRALPGAPVAAPLAWDEVADRGLKPNGFSMRATLERLGADPWAGFRKGARSLGPAMRALGVSPP